MKFQIVSDSSCDLPKERAQELGVDIVPFYVSFEEENYMKEGVDISCAIFVAPSTLQPIGRELMRLESTWLTCPSVLLPFTPSLCFNRIFAALQFDRI